MSNKDMYIFMTLFVISCIVVYVYFDNFSYFISYLVGGFATSLIIFSSFYSYKKNITQNANDCAISENANENANEIQPSNKNNANELQNMVSYENTKKEKLQEKELDKKEQEIKKQFNNVGINFKMFLFLPKILGYVFLCYGFIYLSDEKLLDITFFIVGISVLPAFVFLISSIFQLKGVSKN